MSNLLVAACPPGNRSSHLETTQPSATSIGGSTYQLHRLPQTVSQFIKETDSIFWFNYNFQPHALAQGKITEQGLRGIIKTIRELRGPELSSKGLCVEALAESIYKHLLETNPDEMPASFAFNRKIFIDDILGIINQDPNKPNIQEIRLDEADLLQDHYGAEIKGVLRNVVNLAVDNRINAETLMKVIRYTHPVIHQSKAAYDAAQSPIRHLPPWGSHSKTLNYSALRPRS